MHYTKCRLIIYLKKLLMIPKDFFQNKSKASEVLMVEFQNFLTIYALAWYIQVLVSSMRAAFLSINLTQTKLYYIEVFLWLIL